MGSESPTISRISLQRVDVNKELRTLNNFVFEFDIRYEGGFYMAIHALMKFNSNTAFVSIKGNNFFIFIIAVASSKNSFSFSYSLVKFPKFVSCSEELCLICINLDQLSM